MKLPSEDEITIVGILSIVIPPIVIFGITVLLMWIRPDEPGVSSWAFDTVTGIATAVSYFGVRGIRERRECKEEIRELREQLAQMSSVRDLSSEDKESNQQIRGRKQ